MKTLSERIAFLLAHRSTLERWVGAYDEARLIKWLDAELGDHRRLEQWVDGSRVVPRGAVLHVVSGNTEHAAFQSVFRAILLGCENRVKVPSAGLLEFEAWADEVGLFEVKRELPDDWKNPEVAVIYGGGETIAHFREWLSPQSRIIEHGPKISAAFVFEMREGLEEQLAEDILRYGQRGCLSVQSVYVAGDAEGFCERLSLALEEQRPPTSSGQAVIAATLSEAGAIRNARELARFQIANGAKMKLWESEGSVEWTVLLDHASSLLRTGPTGGFVRVMPMPDVLNRETLGDEVAFLSTAVVEPISAWDRLETLSPPRICAAGQAQEPGIFWHPDGEMPLAGLVRWRDLG